MTLAVDAAPPSLNNECWESTWRIKHSLLSFPRCLQEHSKSFRPPEDSSSKPSRIFVGTSDLCHSGG